MPNGGPQLTATLSLNEKPFADGLKKALTDAEKAERAMENARFRVINRRIAMEAQAAKAMAAAHEKAAKESAARMKKIWRGVKWAAGVGAVGVAGFAYGVQNAYAYGREMMNASRATGIAAKNMAVFDLALKDSQIETSELLMSLRTMDQLILKAAKGDKGAILDFEQLGISYKELINLPMEESFERVGNALAKVENGYLRGAAAQNVFGRNGSKMLKMFERGGALEMAKEALGGSAGIIGKDGGAFEKVAIRLSHIAVKTRQIFIGIADTILPMMDKFTAAFNKMDFTVWGTKLGEQINKAMAWLLAFWNNPEKVGAYFWEYTKVEALELGNILVKSAEMFGEALQSSFAKALPDWLQGAIKGGSSLLGNTWEGIAQLTDVVNYGSDKLFGTGYEPLSKHNQPKGGKAIIESPDPMGAAGARKRLAAMRPTAAFDRARQALGQNTPDASPVVSKYAADAWRFGGIPKDIFAARHMAAIRSPGLDALFRVNAPTFGPTGAAYRGGMSLSNFNASAYDQSDILSHRERERFRSMAIANPNSGVHRRIGETVNGDRQRAKAFAREMARREAGQGTDNQLLGDIARNTAKSAKVADILEQ